VTDRVITLPRPGSSLLADADRELIALLADGMSAAEIGRRLFISERVAQRRVQAILDKTGTRNATHLVATALRCGWLDRDAHEVAA
jgi:DNA-binding CsgD family transcriptional regulator